MTIRSGERHPLVERIGYYVARTRAWAHRATGAGLAIRAAIWLTGAGALVVAVPAGAAPGYVVPAACLVALPAAGAPGTGWVSLVELLAIAAAVAALAVDGHPMWRVLLLAMVLYVHHTAAALGAQLRTDAVIPPAVLRHWGRRTAVVLAGSLPLGLGVAVLARRAPPGPGAGYLALGAAAAVGLVLYLAWSIRTGPGAPRDS